jgi:hypothetical protein
MGYEIKIHIGEISGYGENTIFLEVASLDLAKIGDGVLSKLISFAKGKNGSMDFNDFKFLKNIKGSHLGVDPTTSYIFGVGDEYSNVYIWGTSGDEKITEDLYGDPLPAIPLDHFFLALKEELKTDNYRRFKLAKALLDEFLNSGNWKDIYVVPFGH